MLSCGICHPALLQLFLVSKVVWGFFLYISESLQPLEVKTMLFHCREVLRWKMLPLAGVAVLTFLRENTIPRTLYHSREICSSCSPKVSCISPAFSLLSIFMDSLYPALCEREGERALLLIMEQLKMSLWAALDRGGVEMLVSGKKWRGANGKSWELCGNSCFSADLLSSVMVVNIQQTGGVYGPERHRETHARRTQLYVLETKSSGVKWFCWEESIQIM